MTPWQLNLNSSSYILKWSFLPYPVCLPLYHSLGRNQFCARSNRINSLLFIPIPISAYYWGLSIGSWNSRRSYWFGVMWCYLNNSEMMLTMSCLMRECSQSTSSSNSSKHSTSIGHLNDLLKNSSEVDLHRAQYLLNSSGHSHYSYWLWCCLQWFHPSRKHGYFPVPLSLTLLGFSYYLLNYFEGMSCLMLILWYLIGLFPKRYFRHHSPWGGRYWIARLLGDYFLDSIFGIEFWGHTYLMRWPQ